MARTMQEAEAQVAAAIEEHQARLAFFEALTSRAERHDHLVQEFLDRAAVAMRDGGSVEADHMMREASAALALSAMMHRAAEHARWRAALAADALADAVRERGQVRGRESRRD